MKQILAFLLVTVFAAATLNAGLDDTGEKKVTIGSEISRGHASLNTVGTELELTTLTRALYEVVGEDKQRGTDSDGFMLGAFYGMWERLWLLLKSSSLAKYNEASEVQRGRENALYFHKQFRDLQRKLALTDLEIAKAFGAPTIEEQTQLAETIKDTDLLAATLENPTGNASQSPNVGSSTIPMRLPDVFAQSNIPTDVPPSSLQSFKESQSRAIKAYPSLGITGSHLNTAFVARFRTLRQQRDPLLSLPDWPEKLANKCAADLGAIANR